MKFSSIKHYLSVLFNKNSFNLLADSIKWFIEDHIVPYSKIEKAGNEGFIHPSVNFKSPENVIIGNYTRIQPNVCLWASPNSKIIIGDFSGLGPGTMLFSSNHKYEFGKIYVQQPWVEKDIVIGRNVWVGAGCILTAGVTIGDGSVIGAGSVVNKDVPPNSLAVGVPAKIIKDGSHLDVKHSE